MGSAYVNNRNLFSDYYLAARLPEQPERSEDVTGLRSCLAELLAKKGNALQTIIGALGVGALRAGVEKAARWRMDCLTRLFAILAVLEYFFNRATKSPGDAKCQCQRRNVPAGFESNDRLACNADFFPKFFLRHFAMLKAKPSNLALQPMVIIPGHSPTPACECTR